MTRPEFVAWAQAHGWVMDRFGHLQKTSEGRDMSQHQYRYKLSRVAVRKEVKTGSGQWVRIVSGYYSALSVNEDGKLVGMSR